MRYYMFLFPDTPPFSPQLGGPLLLTPMIEAGQLEEARQEQLLTTVALTDPIPEISLW